MPVVPLRNSREVAMTALRSSERVREDLRQKILTVQLEPGQPLVEPDLAAAYGLSRTPIREALIQLAQEGLVTIRPQSGTFVSRINVKVLPEAIEIRRALEEVAVRKVAALGGNRALLEGSLDDMRRAISFGDLEIFHRIDDAFHASIAEMAGMTMLWQVVQQVKAHIDRYRRLTLPRDGRLTRVLDEHAAIVSGLLDGDAERAVRAMNRHLLRLIDDISLVSHDHSDHFETDREDLVTMMARTKKPGRRARARMMPAQNGASDEPV